jgi:hypothetical protein
MRRQEVDVVVVAEDAEAFVKRVVSAGAGIPLRKIITDAQTAGITKAAVLAAIRHAERDGELRIDEDWRLVKQ